MDKTAKEIICIVCPNGCKIRIAAEGLCAGGKADADSMEITGNGCVRGRDFAIKEMTNPVRSLSTTIRTDSADFPVLPVKLSAEIPKDRVFDMMKEINKMRVTGPVKPGAVLAGNLLGLGTDLIATAGTADR